MSYESFKNTISLLGITLIAGILLGFVYQITKGPIETEQQRAKEQAYQEVFANATSFKEVPVDGQCIQEFKKNGWEVSVEEVMQAFDKEGSLMGYVLTVTDHEGYGGDIRFTMGVQMDGMLNGISFLSLSETAGLGMKAKEPEFKNQFSEKTVESFTYTKNGAVSENEIDAISGATITTNAVTNGVNAGLYYVYTMNGWR